MDNIDISFEALSIIAQHTEDALLGLHHEPTDNDAIYGHLVEECSYILAHRLLSKQYTPMQYILIRNELSNQLYNTFFGE